MNTSQALPHPAVPSSTVPLMAVLLLLDSFHFVFARLLLPLISPRVSAMYVMGIATIVVGVYGLATRQLDWRVLKTKLLFFVLIGFFIGGSTNLTFIAVSYVDPGAASLIAQLSTPLSVALGIFWLKEHFTRGQVLGAALATLGACIIALQPGELFRIGSLMIMIATTLYTAHTALVKRNGDLDFVNFFFFRLLFTTTWLFIFPAVQGQLAWPQAAAWPLLLLVGVVDIVTSRALYYIALRRLNLSVHAVVMTFAPVIAVLWSLLFLHVVPSWQQALGGTVVIMGVLLVTVMRGREGWGVKRAA
jgi:drug/metabolite transporter (DMT)-like permease